MIRKLKTADLDKIMSIFYKNRGFRIDAESLDTDTFEEEYVMVWERNCKT